MFEELTQMSIITSAVTLKSVNGNDLAYFIILLQNNDSAKHTDQLYVSILQKLYDYQGGAKPYLLLHHIVNAIR